MTKKIIPLLSCLFMFACTANQSSVTAKAHIFERKMLGDGKLLVYYAYHTGKYSVKDSGIIENAVLPQDSVAITYPENNPANSQLLLIPGN